MEICLIEIILKWFNMKYRKFPCICNFVLVRIKKLIRGIKISNITIKSNDTNVICLTGTFIFAKKTAFCLHICNRNKTPKTKNLNWKNVYLYLTLSNNVIDLFFIWAYETLRFSRVVTFLHMIRLNYTYF